jgi:hypothetical protein
MEDFREPVELTTRELTAVAGGLTRTLGPMTVTLNLGVTTTVVAGNGVADGVADGVANFVFGNATIGVGNGGGNGGTTIST